MKKTNSNGELIL